MKQFSVLSLLAAVTSLAQVAVPHASRQTALSTAQIAKRTSPSVVVIQVKTNSGDVVGSGFIISKDGKIVTNLHVIRDAETATVQLPDGEIYDSVSVLATDERRDLAIIRVPGFNLPPLELGDSDSLMVGEPLVVLGSPRGLQGSVTKGVLSSVRDSGEGFKILQTDAAVNRGNSGGPLLNSRGQAVGVVSFKLRAAENLNFAVPINYVRGLLTSLHDPIPLEQMRTERGFVTKRVPDAQPQRINEDRLTSSTGTTGSTPLQSYTRSPAATTRINAPVGRFAVWIDATKWRQQKSDQAGRLEFANASGEARAMLIAERIEIPIDSLREAALSNAKSVDPDATIALEEDRIVNKRQIRALQIVGTAKKIPFRLFGYYHSGKSGTIQLLTYTADSLFEEHIVDLTEFLNGLEIADEELPSSQPSAVADASEASGDGLLVFNKGSMSLKYDPTKWKQTASGESGRFTFQHRDGDGYGMVIAERISVPPDSWPEIALSHAKDADPNAKIIFQEKRSVNGVDVWFLKLAAESSKIPLIYYGYYYGGEGGSAQVITYTGRNLSSEYEKDFFEFLNGFRVPPFENKAITSIPEHIRRSRERLSMGVKAFKDSRYEEAARLFKEAIQLDPNNPNARVYLATAYMSQWIPGAESPENKQLAEAARKEFMEVLQKDPKDKNALASLAFLAYNEATDLNGDEKLKKFDEAREWNLKTIEADPKNKTAYYSLGVIDWAKWYPALMAARAKLGMRPEDPGPLKDKKVREKLKAKYGAVIQDGLVNLRKALQIDPEYDDAMAYINLLIRERADLADTPQEYQDGIKTADNWVQRTLDTKQAKAARAQSEAVTP